VKITLGELKSILLEGILLEYDVNPNATLYHRSNKDFKVGDILTGQVEQSTGKHWLEDRQAERWIELERRDHFPNLPSRFNCVYASFIPRSRFLAKGKLYAIEPIGAMHVTNSRIIDDLWNSNYPDHYEIKRYWEGVEPTQGNIGDLEVLLSKARVTAIIDESHRLRENEWFKFEPDAPEINCSLYVIKSSDDQCMSYAANGRTRTPTEKFIAQMQNVVGLKILGEIDESKFRYSSMDLPISVGPGFMGKFKYIRFNEPGKGVYSYQKKGGLAPSGIVYSDDGASLEIDKNEMKKFIAAYRKGSIAKIKTQ
jgi:hypothetical protein